ncbi:hypothetical protein Y032_0018g3551 [Ancylostoma ceylanicum]|nr:hypothetical protein Y032_0018g3551 [Ancylostoma ceylanicum]
MPLVGTTTENGSPMVDGFAVASSVGKDRMRIRRWRMGPSWRSSEENACIWDRRWRTEESARTLVHRLRMGPPCSIGEENKRILVSDGGWVCRGPVVRKTSTYGFADLLGWGISSCGFSRGQKPQFSKSSVNGSECIL